MGLATSGAWDVPKLGFGTAAQQQAEALVLWTRQGSGFQHGSCNLGSLGCSKFAVPSTCLHAALKPQLVYVWASPPSVVWLCDCDQEACFGGLCCMHGEVS